MYKLVEKVVIDVVSGIRIQDLSEGLYDAQSPRMTSFKESARDWQRLSSNTRK